METKPSRSYRIWQLLGILLFVVPACAALNSRFNWVDDSYYLMLAKALATGRGYTNINLPLPVRHSHFPPGLPVFLSLPMLAGLPLPVTVVICKVMLITGGAFGLWGLVHLARAEGYEDSAIPWALAISASSIMFVNFTCRVASEMLYFPLSVFSLLAVYRYRRSAYKSWWLLIAIALISSMILTRSVGAFLFLAVILDMAWKREFRRLLLIAAPVVVILIAWALSNRAATPGTGDYMKEFVYLYRSSRATSPFPALAGIIGNVWVLLSIEIPRTIFSVGSSEVVQAHRFLNLTLLPLRLLISGVALWPILWNRRSQAATTHIYLVIYLIVISLWPSDPSRYLVAIGPFLCFSFVEGAASAIDWISKANVTWAPFYKNAVAAVAAVCIASNLFSDARFVDNVRRTGDFSAQAATVWEDMVAGDHALEQNTSDSSVIGCVPTIEAYVYLMTGRKTVPLPIRQEGWRAQGITHVMELNDTSSYGSVDRRVEARVLKTLNRSVGEGQLTRLYQNADVTIYKVQSLPNGADHSTDNSDDSSN